MEDNRASGENRTVKVTAVLTPAQAAALTAYAAANRWSKSAAIAALIDQYARPDGAS